MANVQYIDNIGIYKNILDPKWCDAVIKHFNKNEKNILDRQKDFGYDSKSVKDKAFFLQDPKLSSYILNILSSKIYEDYINKYPHVPVIQYEIEDLKRIQKSLFNHRDLFVSLDEAAILWQNYSGNLSASWLFLPDKDEDIPKLIESDDYFNGWFNVL